MSNDQLTSENLDDETLAELIEFRRTTLKHHTDEGNKTQAVLHNMVLVALLELQERRKADSAEPIGWTDAEELRSVEKDGCGYLFKANPISPNADPRRVIKLYRHAQPAPVIGAEPVFFIEVEGDDWIQAGRIPGSTFDFNNLPDGINKLYATPQPAPVVPLPDVVSVLLNHLEDVLPDDAFNLIDVKAWNAVSMLTCPDACRAAMLQGKVDDEVGSWNNHKNTPTAKPVSEPYKLPTVSFYRDGIEAAANWVDQQRESYDNEHGRHDNDTGSFEFGNDAHLEYSDTLAEIAEGIRALHPNAGIPPAPIVPEDVMPGGLVYSSALPVFESNDRDKFVGFQCFISGDTRIVESQEQAYADAKLVVSAWRAAMLKGDAK